MTLLDTHYHLDFLAPELREPFLGECAEQGVRVVAQTVLPSEFEDLGRQAGADSPAALPSLGFHPWWITGEQQAEEELAVFAQAVRRTRFIGEIGLDFSPRRLEGTPAELQRSVLQRILGLVAEAAADSEQPYVLSIHAVRSASEVLDLLAEVDGCGQRVVPVFHWFSGTSDELTRLVRLGGFVSVNPAMFGSKRGRAYLKQVPADRLLLESDLPADPVASVSDAEREAVGRAYADELAGVLASALTQLSELRQADMTAEIARTQRRLYDVA